MVFDLDDTLYPERDYALGGFAKVDAFAVAQHGLTGVGDRLRQLFAERLHQGQMFNAVLDAMRVSYDKALIDEMVAHYHAERQQGELQLYPDASAVLTWLRERFLLAIITDGDPRMQRSKVHALQIADRFDKIYCTGDRGREYGKPHPVCFEQAMGDFGLKGNECAYVGNDPSKDFYAGNQLDWLTIDVQRDGQTTRGVAKTPAYEAHHLIQGLGHLKQIFADAPQRAERWMPKEQG